jgi:hypothetical protein
MSDMAQITLSGAALASVALIERLDIELPPTTDL